MARSGWRGSIGGMRRDAHRDALKVAAKVALAIGLLEGCRESLAAAPSAPTLAPTETPVVDTAPATTPDAVAAAPAEPVGKVTDCRAVVYAAFPVDGQYPGERKEVADEVRTCCGHLLVAPGGLETHHWDCCANVDHESEAVAMACTPWGPPVPPAMNDSRFA
jgi:hypothetical protein